MSDPTHIACLTPPGKGAVATLAVRGPLAWAATRELFQSAKPLPEAPAVGQTWLGRLGEEVRDQVVLAVKAVEPAIALELHCHGGVEVIRLIAELYERRGVRPCAWSDLHTRTWQTLAQASLVQAPTLRTANILLDQFHGAFERAIESARQHLQSGRASAGLAVLEALHRHTALGRRLVQPWRVVIAGPPNVGKSSLVNALVGYTRSIVSPQPGTTRDVVATEIALDGWPVELVDTAGLREAASEVEREGVARARQALTDADVCLWLLDGSAAPVPPDGTAWRLVISKADLPPAWDWGLYPDALPESAQTRAGIDALCTALSAWLVPAPPESGDAVPFTPELARLIGDAIGHLNRGDAAAAFRSLQTD